MHQTTELQKYMKQADKTKWRNGQINTSIPLSQQLIKQLHRKGTSQSRRIQHQLTESNQH